MSESRLFPSILPWILCKRAVWTQKTIVSWALLSPAHTQSTAWMEPSFTIPHLFQEHLKGKNQSQCEWWIHLYWEEYFRCDDLWLEGSTLGLNIQLNFSWIFFWLLQGWDKPSRKIVSGSFFCYTIFRRENSKWWCHSAFQWYHNLIQEIWLHKERQHSQHCLSRKHIGTDE